MDICQSFFIYLKRNLSRAALCVLLALGGPGCVALRLPAPSAWPPAPPPPARDPQTLGLYLLLGFLLVLFVWVGLLARRAWQRGHGASPLDREEAALLRTARDALAYLAQRRLSRLRLVGRGRALSPRR